MATSSIENDFVGIGNSDVRSFEEVGEESTSTLVHAAGSIGDDDDITQCRGQSAIEASDAALGVELDDVDADHDGRIRLRNRPRRGSLRMTRSLNQTKSRCQRRTSF